MCARNAALDAMSVTEGGVTFTVVLYEDTRRLKFRLDGTRSFYTFNSANQVTEIEVGKERYKVRRCRIQRRRSTLIGQMWTYRCNVINRSVYFHSVEVSCRNFCRVYNVLIISSLRSKARCCI